MFFFLNLCFVDITRGSGDHRPTTKRDETGRRQARNALWGKRTSWKFYRHLVPREPRRSLHPVARVPYAPQKRRHVGHQSRSLGRSRTLFVRGHERHWRAAKSIGLYRSRMQVLFGRGRLWNYCSLHFLFLFFKDPARVTFTPTVQYLPLRLSGVVRCHVEAHPLFQFITWTKDKRIFDPFETPNVGVLKNGSLLFEKVLGRSKGRWADVAKSASYLGDARKSRALYLHAVQRARNCRLVGHHGSAGQRTADIRDSTQTHIPAQDRRWRPDGLRGSRNPQSPRHLEKSTLQFLSFFFVSWKLWKTLYGFLSLIGWTDGRAASASRPLPGGTWRIDSDQTPAGGFRLLRMSRLQRSGYIGSHCSSGHRRHHAPRSLQHHHRVDRILRQPRVASGLQRWIRLLSKIRYLVQSLS